MASKWLLGGAKKLSRRLKQCDLSERTVTSKHVDMTGSVPMVSTLITTLDLSWVTFVHS